MLTVRDAIPKARELATAEFATLRLRLLKIAARVVETKSRIRLAFAAPVRPTHPSCALQSTGRQAVKSRRRSCAPLQRRSAVASIGPKNRTLMNRTG
jgi:hypothetical protein